MMNKKSPLFLVLVFTIGFSQDFEAGAQKISPPISKQTEFASGACEQAEVAVHTNVNKYLWFGAGFLLGAPGLLIAYLVEPTPRAADLLGKSPEYAAVYRDCYARKGKDKQFKASLAGCGTSVGCCVLYYAFMFSMMSSSGY